MENSSDLAKNTRAETLNDGRMRGCTGALVTGQMSSAGGNMVAQTVDLFVPFWQNIKLDLIEPEDGYRFFTTGDEFGPMGILNEKGVSLTNFFRGARVKPYPGQKKPPCITCEDLMKQSDSAGKFVELWSDNVTKYGTGIPGGSWAYLITGPKEGYLLEVANWIYNDPANHAIHGPFTDQVFAHANFFVSKKLKEVESGIGLGYIRAKRMWQMLIDRQYDSCISSSRGLSLPYLMACFRDHGNMEPEDDRFSVLGVPEERDEYTICTHGLKGYSTSAYVCVSRPDHTGLLSCVWKTFGQPCTSPYLPFYIGVKSLPEEMRTNAAARIFEEIRLAIEYHPEYRESITHFWKIFEIHTMEEATGLEGRVAILEDQGKSDAARQLLTEFVAGKCQEALTLAREVLEKINSLPRFF